MPTLGLSTWSLHRTLGTAYADAPGRQPDGEPKPRWGDGRLSLLDLPAELARRGYSDVQICHFHLPRSDLGYQDSLRERLRRSGIRLDAVLIDDGDLTHPEHGERDRAWIEAWLGVAGRLGARHARLIAGKRPPTEASFERSARHLVHLEAVGRELGVRVVVENWQALLPDAAAVRRLYELTGGRMPLCFDFGNWSGPGKYAQLAAIAPLAVTAHAKCHFVAPRQPGSDDFLRCCWLLAGAGFHGTLALIYDGADPDEWAHLRIEAGLARHVWPGLRDVG